MLAVIYKKNFQLVAYNNKSETDIKSTVALLCMESMPDNQHIIYKFLINVYSIIDMVRVVSI